MANVDNPRGLWPIRHLCGGEIRTNTYIATSGEVFYVGDVVKAVAAGTVSQAHDTDGVACLGVSAEYIASAATGQTIQVYDDPYIVFGIQCDSGTAAAATDVFSTADIESSGSTQATGNASSGLSYTELDSSDLAGASQSLLKVIGLVNSPGNAWGEHADVEVIFNEHLYKAAVAGLGA